jgi:tryptophan synthase alpha chain
MGITGLRTDLDAAARTLVGRLHDAGSRTTCVGIGISTADQVRQVVQYADGAIVGSALVKALSDGGVSALARTAADLATGTSN